MQKCTKKQIKSYLWIFFVCCITSGAVMYFLNGIHLYGLPKTEEIAYVEIKDTRLSDETRELREPDDITNARNIANFLNYEIGSAPQDEAFIFITYHLNNGESIDVSANENTVFWKGKAHKLKDSRLFVKSVEGIFFLDIIHDK